MVCEVAKVMGLVASTERTASLHKQFLPLLPWTSVACIIRKHKKQNSCCSAVGANYTDFALKVLGDWAKDVSNLDNANPKVLGLLGCAVFA